MEAVKLNKLFKEFKKDLLVLLKKHDVGLHIVDEYDGEDAFCGVSYYFKFKGEKYYGDTVGDILEELTEKLKVEKPF